MPVHMHACASTYFRAYRTAGHKHVHLHVDAIAVFMCLWDVNGSRTHSCFRLLFVIVVIVVLAHHSARICQAKAKIVERPKIMERARIAARARIAGWDSIPSAPAAAFMAAASVAPLLMVGIRPNQRGCACICTYMQVCVHVQIYMLASLSRPIRTRTL
jgi:hypothetical protein